MSKSLSKESIKTTESTEHVSNTNKRLGNITEANELPGQRLTQ